MNINTKFVQGNPFEIEFVQPSNQLTYNFVTPTPIQVDFKSMGEIQVAFMRPNNELKYEFSIGKQGPRGEEGDPGSLWFTGSNNPSQGLGTETDIYLNYVSYDLFQKIVDTWVLIGNIKGATGPAGNGQGVLPAGGTTGQRLAKLSNVDFDTTWVTPGDTTFVFDGTGDTWNIQHDLAKWPSVFIIDAGGNQIYADLQYIDNNNVTIVFTSAMVGKAYLN